MPSVRPFPRALRARQLSGRSLLTSTNLLSAVLACLLLGIAACQDDPGAVS